MCDPYDFYKKVNFLSFPGNKVKENLALNLNNLKQKSDWNKLEMDNVNLEDYVFCWTNKTNESMSSTLNEKCQFSHSKHFRLIDTKCKWPDCTSKCLPIKHPDKANAWMNPLEYFNYYGLFSMNELAHRLRVKENTLRKMNYSNLLNLITTKKL